MTEMPSSYKPLRRSRTDKILAGVCGGFARYLGIDPVLARALASNPELTRKVWVALNAIKPATLIGEGRIYGGGLHKLEPKELGNLPADQIIALIPGTVRHSPRQLELFGGERA